MNLDLCAPNGWAPASMRELFEVNPTKVPAGALPSDTPITFVPMAAIDAESGSITTPQERQFDEVRKGYTSFFENDVIVAKITPCMENGKASIARGLKNGVGFGSTEFHVLRPNGSCLPDFIYHFIRQESFRREAERHMTGTVGQKRVPAEFLKKAIIPTPPIAEQERIVAKVEELLARVNAARERLARVPAILKRFRQSILAAACSGRLTADWREQQNDLEPASRLKWRILPKDGTRVVDTSELPEIPKCWAWIYLPQTGEMNRGKSRHRPRNASHLYGGPYPFVQTGGIAQSGGRITSHKQTYSEAGLAQSRLWPEGTVCITIAANIADSAILTYAACFPDSVVGVVTNSELCLPEYLEFFLRTAREDLAAFAPATAQKNINIAILSDVAVPLPPLKEQQEIVHRVESLFQLADTIEKRAGTAQQRVEKMTQAILAKAFRGELVPTEAELARQEGRDYEPAAALLERIKNERIITKKESKGNDGTAKRKGRQRL